ncbi:MAG: TCR/Tet family MFS transporter [Gammaproteobacteria bacterium]|nr:TCR/Tet family MFS transporter [Gammaproteobacteria bacterium]
MAFILITVVLDATGIGLLAPVLPRLIGELSGADLTRAAVYGGWITALFAIVQFLAAPLLGNLSDRFGRRPVLLASLAAFGLNYLVMGFAPSLAWLFVAQAVAGLCGATAATAGAYLADISNVGNRAKHFGMMGGAFSFGFVIGPVLGGVLGNFGLRVPIFVAAGLALVNFVYGLLVLPESLKPEYRRPFSLARAHVLGTLRQVRRHPLVFGILGGVLLMSIAGQTLPAIWPYFTMHKFGWNEQQIGYSLGAYGLLGILAQAWLIPALMRRFGPRGTALVGQMLGIASLVGFAVAPTSLFISACIVPSALSFVAWPAMSSIMSAHTPPQSQGELQGAIASAQSLAAVVTPLAMPRVFSSFAATDAPLYFPGAAFLLAALLLVGSAVVVRRVTRGLAPLPGAAVSQPGLPPAH